MNKANKKYIKVLADANLINIKSLEELKKSKAFCRINQDIELYASEVMLKQTLAHQYKAGNRRTYDYIVKFIKNNFNKQIVAASRDIVMKELTEGFHNEIFSKYITNNIKYYSKVKYLDLYNAVDDNIKKKETVQNYKDFIKKIKDEIAKLNSKQDWRDYSFNFVYKYNFAVPQLDKFLKNQKYYNRETFVELLKLWWKYSIIMSTLTYFKVNNAGIICENIINGQTKIPDHSYLSAQFKLDEFILEHSFVLGKKADDDIPNDITYVALMQQFDVLLTGDTKFMKDCFSKIYEGRNKKILKLDEFIREYS